MAWGRGRGEGARGRGCVTGATEPARGRDMDLHGYHPHTIERTGLIASLVQQSWEMGLSSLELIHGHALGRPGTPRPFANTNTGWLGLTVGHILRSDRTLRQWMYHYLRRNASLQEGGLPGIRDGSGWVACAFLALNGLAPGVISRASVSRECASVVEHQGQRSVALSRFTQGLAIGGPMRQNPLGQPSSMARTT